jgi:hypothetical protein
MKVFVKWINKTILGNFRLLLHNTVVFVSCHITQKHFFLFSYVRHFLAKPRIHTNVLSCKIYYFLKLGAVFIRLYFTHTSAIDVKWNAKLQINWNFICAFAALLKFSIIPFLDTQLERVKLHSQLRFCLSPSTGLFCQFLLLIPPLMRISECSGSTARFGVWCGRGFEQPIPIPRSAKYSSRLPRLVWI